MSLLPLLAIPVNYVLAIYPHTYAVSKGLKGDMRNHDNSNPSGTANQAALRKRLTDKEMVAFERAKACHRNAMENLPLMIAAIFAGLLAQEKSAGFPALTGGAAKADVVGVGAFAVGWTVLRVVYTINYLTVESRRLSIIRSLAWSLSGLWACVVIGRAAFV